MTLGSASSRFRSLFEHDLFRERFILFPDHALAFRRLLRTFCLTRGGFPRPFNGTFYCERTFFELYFGMTAESVFAFVDACAGDTPIEELIAQFKRVILGFGFDSSACGSWHGVGEQRSNRFFFVDWPEEVVRLYAEKNIERRDPLVFAARRRMTPFVWDEVYSDPHLPAESKELYQFAHDFGWVDGMCVPVHGPAGYQGLISMLARSKLALSPRERGLLELAARSIHEACRHTLGFGVSPEPVPVMTARELECMKWVAVGKSDWEIAQMLRISESTVHFHVENAKKKLKKSTRTEAVALLVLHGLM